MDKQKASTKDTNKSEVELVSARVSKTKKEIEALKDQLQQLITSGISKPTFTESRPKSCNDSKPPEAPYKNTGNSEVDLNKAKALEDHVAELLKPSAEPFIPSKRPQKRATENTEEQTKKESPKWTKEESPKQAAKEPESPKKVKNYDQIAAREYIKKQQEKHRQLLKKQKKEVVQNQDIKKKRLQELREKSHQLVAQNLRHKRERSQSRSQEALDNPQKRLTGPMESKSANHIECKSTNNMQPDFEVASNEENKTWIVPQSQPNPDAFKRKQWVKNSDMKVEMLQDYKHEEKISPLQKTEPPKVHPQMKNVTVRSSFLNLGVMDLNIKRHVQFEAETPPPAPVQPSTSLVNQQEDSEKFNQAAIKIQAAYRDYQQRKSKVENATKEVQTVEYSPEWLNVPSSVPYPYNFINAVKRKLNLAIQTKTSDVAVQSSLRLEESKKESRSSSRQEKSKEESQKRSADLKSFLSQKCIDLDIKPLPLPPNDKLSNNNVDSDSDTSKNIPDISSESNITAPKHSSKRAHSSDTEHEDKPRMNIDKVKKLKLVQPKRLDFNKKSLSISEHISKHSKVLDHNFLKPGYSYKKGRDSIIASNRCDYSEKFEAYSENTKVGEQDSLTSFRLYMKSLEEGKRASKTDISNNLPLSHTSIVSTKISQSQQSAVFETASTNSAKPEEKLIKSSSDDASIPSSKDKQSNISSNKVNNSEINTEIASSKEKSSEILNSKEKYLEILSNNEKNSETLSSKEKGSTEHSKEKEPLSAPLIFEQSYKSHSSGHSHKSHSSGHSHKSHSLGHSHKSHSLGHSDKSHSSVKTSGDSSKHSRNYSTSTFETKDLKSQIESHVPAKSESSIHRSKSESRNSSYDDNTQKSSTKIESIPEEPDYSSNFTSISVTSTVPSLKLPAVSLTSKLSGRKNEAVPGQQKIISVKVKPGERTKVENTVQSNEIHLKFEAELHLLSDINDSLRQIMAVDKSLDELHNKNIRNKIIHETRDTQTSFVTRSTIESVEHSRGTRSDEEITSKTRDHHHHHHHKSKKERQVATVNYSRGSDVTEDIDILSLSDTLKHTNDTHELSLVTTGLELSQIKDIDVSTSFDDSKSQIISRNEDDNVYTGLSLNMFEQLIKDEDARIENLKTILKIREKALVDRTKGELAWLEIQKKHLRDSGQLQNISAIKKKQRGLLIKLEHERHEMQRLKQMQKLASKKRKSVLREQSNMIKTQLSSTNMITKIKRSSREERKQPGPLKVYNIKSHSESVRSETSMSRKSSVSEEVVSVTSHSQSIVSHIMEEIVLDGTAPATSQDVVSVQTEHVKHSLLMRETALRKRRKAAEELLQWHQRLVEEEEKIAELERQANAIVSQTVMNIASDDTSEKHKFKGSQLNLLWHNMTGRDEKKFNDNVTYPMSKASLEAFCKDTKKSAVKRSLDKKSHSLSDGNISTDMTITEVVSKGKINLNSSADSSYKPVLSKGTPKTNDYSSDFESVSLKDSFNSSEDNKSVVEEVSILHEDKVSDLTSVTELQKSSTSRISSKPQKSSNTPSSLSSKHLSESKTELINEITEIIDDTTTKEKTEEIKSLSDVKVSRDSTSRDVITDIDKDASVKIPNDHSSKISSGIENEKVTSDNKINSNIQTDKISSYNVTSEAEISEDHSGMTNSQNSSIEDVQVDKVSNDVSSKIISQDSHPSDHSNKIGSPEIATDDVVVKITSDHSTKISCHESMTEDEVPSDHITKISSQIDQDSTSKDIQTEVEEKTEEKSIEIEELQEKSSESFDEISSYVSFREATKEESHEESILQEKEQASLSAESESRTREAKEIATERSSEYSEQTEASSDKLQSENDTTVPSVIKTSESPKTLNTEPKSSENKIPSEKIEINESPETVEEVETKSVSIQEKADSEKIELDDFDKSSSEVSLKSEENDQTEEEANVSSAPNLIEQESLSYGYCEGARQAKKAKDVSEDITDISENFSEQNNAVRTDSETNKDEQSEKSEMQKEETELTSQKEESVLKSEKEETEGKSAKEEIEFKNKKEETELKSEKEETEFKSETEETEPKSEKEETEFKSETEETEPKSEKEETEYKSETEETEPKSEKEETEFKSETEETEPKSEKEESELKSQKEESELKSENEVSLSVQSEPCQKMQDISEKKKSVASKPKREVSVTSLEALNLEVNRSRIVPKQANEGKMESIDVKKRVLEILSESNLPKMDKSPRQDFYVTTYDVISPEHSSSESPTDDLDPLLKTNPMYVNDEVQQLLKKQLEIEQEIKEIQQQQQKEHIPYLYVREIPNKPPPPYTPPGAVQPPATGSVLPASEKQVETVAGVSAGILHEAYLNNNLNSISLSSNDYISLQKSGIEKTCAEFIFDLCKDVAIDHYGQFKTEEGPSWMQLAKRSKLALGRPLDKSGLEKLTAKKVREWLGYEIARCNEDIKRKWSSKRRDHVDELLVKECQLEEAEWTNYDKDELIVKDELTKEIMNMLLSETVQIFDKILAKKTFLR